MSPLAANIESLLFYIREPLDVKAIARHTKKSEDEVRTALEELQNELGGRGIRLSRSGNNVQLVTASEAAALLSSFAAAERASEMGKAALETLSIVLYKGPLTRTEIEYIRGVNSTFILRSLRVRGLVERIPNPKDQRGYLYQPTLDLLAHIGIEKVEDLPEFEPVKGELEAFEAHAETGNSDV